MVLLTRELESVFWMLVGPIESSICGFSLRVALHYSLPTYFFIYIYICINLVIFNRFMDEILRGVCSWTLCAFFAGTPTPIHSSKTSSNLSCSDILESHAARVPDPSSCWIWTRRHTAEIHGCMQAAWQPVPQVPWLRERERERGREGGREREGERKGIWMGCVPQFIIIIVFSNHIF